MTILNVELDPCVAMGFTGGPEFSTLIRNLKNGRERRKADWDNPRHRWTAPFANLPAADFRSIKRMFLVCKGQVFGWFFKDPADHAATNGSLGTAPAGTTAVKLKVISEADGVSYERTNFQAYAGFTVYEAGSPKAGTYDDTTNEFTPDSAWTEGAALTWTGEFRIPVRFATDWLPFSIDNKRGDGEFAMSGSVDICEIPLGELAE